MSEFNTALIEYPSPPTAEEPLVEAQGITKRFGNVVANDNISLAIRRGEIHAVLGENGAGKTTLLNILSGMERPDAGTIRVRGEAVTLAAPHDALARGIGTVYQHFTLVPTLSVVENVILGMEAGFLLDLTDAERRVGELLGELGLAIAPRTPVRHLAIGQRQRVEILKALFRGSEALLLDEPTSVLTPVEVEGLFRILLRLKAEGVALVLITHKLEEALAVSDRITVLRQGRKVGELGPDDLRGGRDAAGRARLKRRVVDLMFGGLPPETGPEHAPPETGPVVLALREVSALGDRSAPAVQGISLDLRAGEIFGIAGVDGNGQKELAEVIAGQRHVTAGRVVLNGVDITNRGVAAAAKAGVGYVTDDRLGEGCVPSGSVAENLVLKTIGKPPFANRFLLNRRAIDEHARQLIERFDVRTPGPGTRLALLSGGNIQKLLLARELAANPTVLVCNKPTAGLDLKTARFVLQTLRAQADQGKVVLLISAELDELLEISDRLGVIFGGRLMATFPRAEVDLEMVGRLMIGVRPPPAPQSWGELERAASGSPQDWGAGGGRPS